MSLAASATSAASRPSAAPARGERRPASVVMDPKTLGAARLCRYSFNRTMLRRAVTDGWQARRVAFDIDASGAGEAVYALDTGSHLFHFVAFTRVLDESEHTDRVIADRWEISACLVEGPVDDSVMQMLRREIPQQEQGRLDSRVLVLTRGNRSVRFFDYLVRRLAAGRQPEGEQVADSGYIMRSTAFYGNGKYGMRSYEAYDPDHPFRVPYRAQFACAWLFREMSVDIVEHCAQAQSPAAAVPFDDEWRRFFGLGNATGLGLVPYAFKHPRVIDAWQQVRETALAEVRTLDGTPERLALLDRWIDRAAAHVALGTDAPCPPFLSPQQLRPVIDRIRNAFDEVRHDPQPFDALYRWAESAVADSVAAGDDASVAEVDTIGSSDPTPVETREFVVALLIELHDPTMDGRSDHELDDLLAVDEHASGLAIGTVADARRVLDDRFGWLSSLDLDSAEADAFWWVISDNTEEPRRVRRARLGPAGRDVAIDVALRLHRLRAALAGRSGDEPLTVLLAEHPEHRLAVDRLHSADAEYGEPRDNACDGSYLPLQLQRFQLAMYGMDNFKPKSTDWLRVTLFQGAPRIADLMSGDPARTADEWAMPPHPGSAWSSNGGEAERVDRTEPAEVPT